MIKKWANHSIPLRTYFELILWRMVPRHVWPSISTHGPHVFQCIAAIFAACTSGVSTWYITMWPVCTYKLGALFIVLDGFYFFFNLGASQLHAGPSVYDCLAQHCIQRTQIKALIKKCPYLGENLNHHYKGGLRTCLNQYERGSH